MIPCYNEVENVDPMAMAVENVLNEALPQYDYEILFIDNCSTDGTGRNWRLSVQKIKSKGHFQCDKFQGQFNSPFMECVDNR